MPTRVMIVETDPEMRNELARILRASPHGIAAEVTGPEGAVGTFTKIRPDVVITRLVFPPSEEKPRMGGMELIKLLKTIDENVRVIVSYDVSTRYLVMNAMRAGAAGRIRLPYRYESVMRAIGNVISPESAGAGLVRLERPLTVTYRPARRWIGRSQRIASSSGISFTQILLHTEEKLREGTDLDLEIVLPRLEEPLRGQAKVGRVTAVVAGRSYEVECSLAGLSDGDRRKLDVFLVWGKDGVLGPEAT